jgi:hypothetical protein
MADALGTFLRMNLVNLRPHENCFVRALRLAHVAIDAFIGNGQGHHQIIRVAIKVA